MTQVGYPVAFAVGGSDPSGGAGLQADLKTFAVTGAFGTTCVTSLTVGDTRGVRRVIPLTDPDVTAQARVVLDDIPPDVVKLGLLPTRGVVEAMAQALEPFPHLPMVLDPVIATHRGDALLPEEAERALISHFLRRATVVTPNVAEAERLTGMRAHDREDMERVAGRIQELGARSVLLKGGHLSEDVRAADVLLTEDGTFVWLDAPRLQGVSMHGAGCTLAAALASGLGWGLALVPAARWAKAFVHGAIEGSRPLGHGSRPLHHGFRLGSMQIPSEDSPA